MAWFPATRGAQAVSAWREKNTYAVGGLVYCIISGIFLTVPTPFVISMGRFCSLPHLYYKIVRRGTGQITV